MYQFLLKIGGNDNAKKWVSVIMEDTDEAVRFLNFITKTAYAEPYEIKLDLPIPGVDGDIVLAALYKRINA